MDLTEMGKNDLFIKITDNFIEFSRDNVSIPLTNSFLVAQSLQEHAKDMCKMFIECTKLGYNYYVTQVVPLLSTETLRKGYAIFRHGSPGIIN